MPSKKEIEDLGAPWLAMGSVAAQDDYRLPPSSPNAEVGNMYRPSGSDPAFTLQGYGSGAARDPRKRMDDLDWQIRFGHRRAF